MSTEPQDHQLSTSQGSSNDQDGAESLTPLEHEVLDEYARLLSNLNTMSTLLSEVSQNPSAELLDGLRGLERKTSLVFTLLKASVYSIVLNQQIQDEPGEGGSDGLGMGLGGSRGSVV